MRLVEGTREWNGRLEVCINRQWGSVCERYFEEIDARVVCRELGYQAESKMMVYMCIYCMVRGRTKGTACANIWHIGKVNRAISADMAHQLGQLVMPIWHALKFLNEISTLFYVTTL